MVLIFKYVASNLELSITMGFDLIGSGEKAVAIVEIPEGADEKRIAEDIIEKNKNVKSVLKKISERRGELRLRECELIAGDADTEVTHKEHGYSLRLDPQKVYFSPRESRERQRIAEQVRPNETVLVMFSGVAAIPIAIAKKQPEVRKIYCIEINPAAHRYAQENVRINKLSHKIYPVCGDVKGEAKKIPEKFDRIAMPLPLGAKEFLDVAFDCLEEGGIIHFYDVGNEGKLFLDSEKIIAKSAKCFKKEYKILKEKIVLPYSPRKFKVVLDVQIKKI